MSRSKETVLFFAMGLVMCALAGGCSQERAGEANGMVTKSIAATSSIVKPDVNASAESQAAEPEKVGEDAAEALIRPPYNPEGRIDPFSPLFRQESVAVEEAPIQAEAAPERPRTPLERLELGQLKLVAVVFPPNNAKALVEEASGKGYVVELGTPIGRERGKVVQILEDKIVIKQEYQDDFGDRVVKERELKLQKPPGE